MTTQPLGQFLKTVKGKKPNTLYEDAAPGRIPYIDIAAVEQGIPRQFADPKESRVVPKGTLIMVWDGARSGWVGFTPFEGALGSTLAALESPLNSRFLASYLKFNFRTINTNHRGSGIPHVNPDFLYALQVPILNGTEQRALAARAEAVADKARVSRKHVAAAVDVTQHLREGILASACDGRLTTDWRGSDASSASSAADLLERLDVERESSSVRWKMPDSGDSPGQFEWPTDVDLPDTWVKAPIGLLIAAQNGRAFPSKEYQHDGIRLLRPGNLKGDGTVSWTDKNTAHLPGEWAERFPDFVLGQGELVMNLTAQSLKDAFLGRVCMKLDEEPALLNQRIARFRPYGDTDLRRYLFLYFRSPRFRAYVSHLDTGTLIRHMHTKSVLAHELPLPPMEEQLIILERVEQLLGELDHTRQHAEQAGERIDRLGESILKQTFGLAA